MAVTLPCDPGPASIGSVPLQGCWGLPCPAALDHPEGPGRVIVFLWSGATGSPHSWFRVSHGAQLPGHPPFGLQDKIPQPPELGGKPCPKNGAGE